MYHHQQNAITAGAAFSAKVSNSSSKMRYLLIHTSLSAGVNGAANATDLVGGVCSTANSVFSSSPATCMPYASLTNIQCLVGGQPLYETPLTYTYEQFQQHFRGFASMNGGLANGLSTGIISEREWDTGYGYVVIDLSRYETDAADNVSKPLEVRATNNSSCTVDLNFFLMTEAEFSISTTTGKVTM
jgi:hypothetical protein